MQGTPPMLCESTRLSVEEPDDQIPCFTALYFAPIASYSNSGSRSCQTFNVSTTIELLPDLHASMNDLVRRLWDSLRSPSYFDNARAALSIRPATSLGCET
jgi:hypothetical protein